ncbi:hypothetical protein BUALT_Bualt08G0110500 [Buddleja alternifolia]|uniref:Pentatricopeptide repeat-containing protein n=1 Tax=Buddleja alternifolia TaxID=168488 RepID=A0AAV6X707_9LAMI|nr:hypothetical protein BUALT_Bualt08G0110500 [Buddleja alternifolia]
MRKLSCYMGTNTGSVLRHLLSSGATTTVAHRLDSQLSAKAVTTTILNYVRLGRLPKAVSLLFSFAFPLPFSLYAHLFRICASNKAIVETRKLESHLVTFTPNPPVFLLNRAIESYGRCSCLEDAQELFDEMPVRDGGSWNAMITAYSRNGRSGDALGLFYKMIGEGVYASEVTFASVLGSCGDCLELWLSRQVHGLVVKYGFVGNVILDSSLVDVYGKCGMMSDARRMFDEIENPNDVSWNVIVRRYLEIGEGNEAVNMFSRMVRMKVRPLSYTVSNAVLACLSFGGLKEGVQIHGYGVKINVEEDEVVSSTLISMYAKCGDLESARRIFDLPCSNNLISYTSMVSGYAMSGRMKEARELFDKMPKRTVISWNVMLAGYTRFLEWDKALEFVILMRQSTADIDHVTLGLILNMCAAIPDMELGKQVHGFAYRHGFFSNLFVGNALLDMYGKCGNLTRARIWFYEMSHLRDKVSWNALLTSYARHGMSEEAMMIFWKMLGETRPSKFTFGTLLAACANIFALELGKQIHAFMIRNGYDIDIVVNGALVDMYSKCRCVLYAINVFNESASKDVILCNSMIFCCSHNGMGGKVVEIFETMEKEGIKADHVTFQGVLRACICEGRVEMGRKYFELMNDKYYLMPQLEHCESMIELYGQYGFMDELELFIQNMPFEPTARILAKVFDYSRKYKCFRLGKWASDRLNELNPLVPFCFEIIDNPSAPTIAPPGLAPRVLRRPQRGVGQNDMNCAPQGKQLHLLFLKKGVLFSTLSIANRLLQMYARCGSIDDARNLFDEMPQRNSFTWNTLLEGYAKSGHRNDLLNLFYSMPDRNEFSWNVILSGLARAGELDVAHKLFSEMPIKNGIAWNTMIHGYARNGGSRMALLLFNKFLKWEMLQNGGKFDLDPFILATVIGACAELGVLNCGKQIHARMIVDDVECDSILGSSIVNMYGKCYDLDSASHVLNAMDDPDDYSLSSLISGYANCSRMNDARNIFELKSNPCVVLWNSLISGYVANNEAAEALLLFDTMHKQGVGGDYSTFSSVLSACSSIGILRNCIQLHDHTQKTGIINDLVVSSALIDAYSKCGRHDDACNLFGELETHDTVLLNSMITICFTCGRIGEAKSIFSDMKSKSLISWNSMIVGLSQNGYPVEALDLFCTMNNNNLSMDKFTFASVISACASIPLYELGEQLFGKAIIIGVDFDQVIATSLIAFYCKCGFVETGRKLFNQMLKSDEVSWNSMLMGYATNGYGIEALSLFREMRNEGVMPNEVTFTAVLSACNHCGLLEEGKYWFFVMKNDYHIDPGIEHYSCMVDLFARAGCLKEAIGFIQEMPYQCDANIWSAVLRGCIESGDKSLCKDVVERVIELDPQNSGALVQLSGVMASTGDWKESALMREMMRDMRIQKNPGRSWCNV